MSQVEPGPGPHRAPMPDEVTWFFAISIGSYAIGLSSLITFNALALDMDQIARIWNLMACWLLAVAMISIYRAFVIWKRHRRDQT